MARRGVMLIAALVVAASCSSTSHHAAPTTTTVPIEQRYHAAVRALKADGISRCATLEKTRYPGHRVQFTGMPRPNGDVTCVVDGAAHWCPQPKASPANRVYGAATQIYVVVARDGTARVLHSSSGCDIEQTVSSN